MYSKISEPLVILSTAMKEAYQLGLFGDMPSETQKKLIELGISKRDYDDFSQTLKGLSKKDLEDLEKGTYREASEVTASLKDILKKFVGKKKLLKLLATALVTVGPSMAGSPDSLSKYLENTENLKKFEMAYKNPSPVQKQIEEVSEQSAQVSDKPGISQEMSKGMPKDYPGVPIKPHKK